MVTNDAPAVGASIVNMCAADGSGSGCDGTPWKGQPLPSWTAQIEGLQNAGITPLVYIATDYGDAGGSPAFSLATVESEVSAAAGLVEAEILDAVQWYNTPSVMLDQVPTACSDVPYYQTLYDFVHTLGGIVMLDSGTVTASSSCYLSASDILGVFNGPQSGFQAMSFPSWLASYPSSRFAVMISAGTSQDVGADFAYAARDGIGNVYIDDEAEPPDYAELPSFWPAELAEVIGVNGRQPGKTPIPLYRSSPDAS